MALDRIRGWRRRSYTLESVHDDVKLEFNAEAPNGGLVEGYLFKRANNAFKTWNRRLFSIKNCQLVYQKKLKDPLTVMVEDLQLCSIEPCEDIRRKFCFKVISPTKSWKLQAESEKVRQVWIQAFLAVKADRPDTSGTEDQDRNASPPTSSGAAEAKPEGVELKDGAEAEVEAEVEKEVEVEIEVEVEDEVELEAEVEAEHI